MESLAGAASAIAIVSLAVQLVETVQKISNFLHSVHDAPDEILSLAESLDQLRQHLDHAKLLVEQQSGLPDHPGSISPLTSALASCKIKVERLATVVDKLKKSFASQSRLHRKWASLRVVCKKEEIDGHRGQIRDADAMLQSAILLNIALATNMIRQQVHVITVSPTPSDFQRSHSALDATKVLSRRASNLPTDLGVVLEQSNTQRYRAFFGSITTRKTSKRLTANRSSRLASKTTIEEGSTILITVPFLQRAFEICLANSAGRVSRTLSVYAILPRNSLVFQLCRDSDVEGLQNLFANDNISPFVQDELGWTLLHTAAASNGVDVCAWLVGLGVDIHRRSHSGRLAMSYVNWGPFSEVEGANIQRNNSQIVDTIKVLAPSLADASLDDVIDYLDRFEGPSEAIELMFIQDCGGVATSHSHDELIWYHVLLEAVGKYSLGCTDWEHLIRRLLRKGIAAHPSYDNGMSQVPSASYFAFQSRRSTLLDGLFFQTCTPFEAEKLGDSWLQLLSSEGYDVVEYLKMEMALHAPDQEIVHYTGRGAWNCRTTSPLVYSFKNNCGVSWKWVQNPATSILPLQDEFEMIMYSPIHDYFVFKNMYDYESSTVSWPFHYLMCYGPEVGDDDCIYHEDCDAALEHKNERAQRRERTKAFKLARFQRSKDPRRIPGAWPS